MLADSSEPLRGRGCAAARGPGQGKRPAAATVAFRGREEEGTGHETDRETVAEGLDVNLGAHELGGLEPRVERAAWLHVTASEARELVLGEHRILTCVGRHHDATGDLAKPEWRGEGGASLGDLGEHPGTMPVC